MKANKVFLVIMLVGLAAASYLALARFQVEGQYKTYEVTMDLEEIRKVAALEGISLADSLARWKEVGIDSVTISEASLDNLRRNNEYKVRTWFEGYDLVVEASSQGVEFIEAGLREVMAGQRQILRRGPNQILIEGIASDFAFKFEVSRDFLEKRIAVGRVGEISKLQFMGLGFLPEEINQVKQAGLGVRLRPTYMPGVQEAKPSIDRFMAAVKEYSNQSYVLFYGESIMGMDTDPDYMVEAMKANKLAVAMVETSVQREHLDQEGLIPLVEKLDYQAIRMFSTWNYIQKRYDYGLPLHHHGQEIISTYYRAITERNIRLIFFKPFITSSNHLISDYQVYQARFADLEARLASHGLRRVHQDQGQALEVMPYLRGRPAVQMLVALGVIACLILVITNFIAIKEIWAYGFFALAGLATAAIYLLQIRVASFNLLFGLGATILFAILPVQFIMAYSKKLWDQAPRPGKIPALWQGVWLLILSVLIALGGAICEAAFYAESKYLLELGIFKGVKISQLLPLLVAVLVAFRYFGNDILGQADLSPQAKVKYVLNLNLKLWHAMVAGVLLAGVGLLLIRSGHESGLQPANLELLVRNILEEVLLARPRNKAFLVGFPAVIILVYWAYQQRLKLAYPILALMAGVGYANLLNTFSHIRTPLYLSLVRIGYEVIFAITMALVYIGILEGIQVLANKCKQAWSADGNQSTSLK